MSVWMRVYIMCGSPLSLNFIFCSFFFFSDLNQQIRALTLNAKNICSIHCWQNTKVSEVFKFDQDTVTFGSFLQWMRGKFSGVIPFSHGCSVKVYYLSDLKSWEKRTRINNDEALRSNLMLVSSDMYLKSYIMVSITQESPTKPPCNDNASTKQSSVVSGLTNHSRGSVQGNFHQRVLTRDGCSCVFCGNCVKAHLKAAHIFDVFRAADIPDDDVDFLQHHKILNLYDTSNGITLCSECHDVFDALLCCVKVVVEDDVMSHKIVVANALKSSPEFTEKWSQLDGADVRVPTEPLRLKHWPPIELFLFREAKYDENTVKRHQLAQDLPTICKCGKRTKSAAGLANHMRSKACLESMTTKSNKFSKLFTPVKTSTVKKPQAKRKKPQSAGKKTVFN